jgi:hypothetical protein
VEIAFNALLGSLYRMDFALNQRSAHQLNTLTLKEAVSKEMLRTAFLTVHPTDNAQSVN